MRVAEKQECDPNCHRGSGCSERGEGKCDSYCVTGFGLDPNTYTCMGECDLVARWAWLNHSLLQFCWRAVKFNEWNRTGTNTCFVSVLFQFVHPLDSTGWARNVGHRLMTIIVSNLKRFQKCFHWKFLGKFLVMWKLKIPPHLAYVTTLPCETLILILILSKRRN